MPSHLYRWSDIKEDNPIPLLTRRRVSGDRILVAKVHLDPGCYVAPHSHESEQIAVMISGLAKWKIGPEGGEDEFLMKAGEVLHLPSNIVHSVTAIEACDIIDLLSPPGPMGVDSQGLG